MSDTIKRASRARTSLILTKPYYGALSLRLNLVETERIPTAATDAINLYLNPGYVAGMNDSYLKGLIAHEVLHCALGHLWRRGSRLPDPWNIACDYEIDPIIIADGMQVPDQTVNPLWQGWHCERIYPELLKGGGGHQSKPRDYLLNPQDEEKPKAELQAEWKIAAIGAAQIAKAQGHLPKALENLLLEALEPKVDWAAETRRFMQQITQNDYSWAKRNIRYTSGGIFLPALHSSKLGPIVIGSDTSGSMWTSEVQSRVKSEMNAIISESQPEITYAVHCDSKVRKVDAIGPDDEFKFQPKGGGGTDFRPVFDWVEKEEIEPACLIYLTDGEGYYPEEPPPYPVLWGMTGKYIAPFGESVRIE
jgi:predicted metal-dependent peptidase